MIATKGGNYSLAGAGKTAIAGGTVPSPGSCTASGTTLQTTIQTSLAATATITGTWRCTVPGVGTGPGTAGPDTEVVVTVADVFRGGATSVAITTTITTDNPVPFTQALRTPLTWASDGGGAGLSTVWTSWGKGCVVNNGKRPGMCFASGAWAPGLAAESLTAHGNGYYRSVAPPVSQHTGQCAKKTDAGQTTKKTKVAAASAARHFLGVAGAPAHGPCGGPYTGGRCTNRNLVINRFQFLPHVLCHMYSRIQF